MKIYYLDEPLTSEQVEYVKEMMKDVIGNEDLEQMRIPHLFPVPEPDENSGAFLSRCEEEVRPLLRAAGIHSQAGRRVILALSSNVQWNATLQYLIYAITGSTPFVLIRGVEGNPEKLIIYDPGAL
jgi:hypothetical protein